MPKFELTCYDQIMIGITRLELPTTGVKLDSLTDIENVMGVLSTALVNFQGWGKMLPLNNTLLTYMQFCALFQSNPAGDVRVYFEEIG